MHYPNMYGKVRAQVFSRFNRPTDSDITCGDIVSSVEHIISNPWFWYICIIVWIVGVMGNLSSILVFHKRSRKSYINSLFCCLAVFDFFELISLALLSSVNKFDPWKTLFSFLHILTSFSIDSFRRDGQRFNVDLREYLYPIYSLLFFHSASILMNIALALSQYLYVVYLLKYKILFYNNYYSTLQTVIGALFFGSFFSLSLLGSFIHNVQESSRVNLTFNENATCKYNLISGGYGQLNDSASADTLCSLFNAMEEIMRPKNMLNERISFTCVYFESKNEPRFISLLESPILIHIGLIVVLFVACIALIQGSIKVCRTREEFLHEAQIPDHQQRTENELTKKVISRMINRSLVIVVVFSITEIPIVLTSILSLSFFVIVNRSDMSVDYSTASISAPYNNCTNSLTFTVGALLLMALLISSCYTIFCYLIMSTEYRDTLKFLLSSGYKYLKRPFSRLLNMHWCGVITKQPTSTSDTTSNEIIEMRDLNNE